MIQTYAKGARGERAVQKKLEKEGWLVIRSAGSKKVDLVAMKNGETRLIEVKEYNPNPKRLREIRKHLQDLERQSGYDAELMLPINKGGR